MVRNEANLSFLDRLREIKIDSIEGDNHQAGRMRQAKLDLDRAEYALHEAQSLGEERDRRLARLKEKQAAEEEIREAAAREKLLQEQREYAERMKQGHEQWLQCLANHGCDISRVDQLKAVTQDC